FLFIYILLIMEKNIKIEEVDKQINHYFILENKIKEMLDETLKRVYESVVGNLSENEKILLKIKNKEDLNINWILNINSVYTNRGELSTSSLQKVINTLFSFIIVYL